MEDIIEVALGMVCIIVSVGCFVAAYGEYLFHKNDSRR